MHPCLNVDEILRLLACELFALEAKATAVSLACCCKGFEDPVLDALWGTQDRLFPLLKSFPEDVWKVESGRFVSQLKVFILPLSDRATEEVFQETPNERGMESFPKIRSGNTGAQHERLHGPGNSRGFGGATESHR
jgi:hypothetical protein